MQRITLSVGDDLVEALDRHMRRRRYGSRSEALRDILREAQARQRQEDAGDGHCVATLTYVYDHETRELGQRLTQAQHRHHDLQVATMHIHLDHDSCLEVSLLRGPARAVQKLADDTISQRGVRHGHLHLVPATVDRREHGHGGGRHSHDHVRV